MMQKTKQSVSKHYIGYFYSYNIKTCNHMWQFFIGVVFCTQKEGAGTMPWNPRKLKFKIRKVINLYSSLKIIIKILTQIFIFWGVNLGLEHQ